jgi:hypothetical protein
VIHLAFKVRGSIARKKNKSQVANVGAFGEAEKPKKMSVFSSLSSFSYLWDGFLSTILEL